MDEVIKEKEQKIKQTQEASEPVLEEVPLNKKEIRKQKRAERREKRYARIRKKYFKDDIKYQGPLSYRYLRILGWIAFAFAQFALLNSIGRKIGWAPINETTQTIFNYLGTLMTPCLIIASFGLVLGGTRGYRNFIIIYGAGFLAIGLGIIFAYYRYINGLFAALGLDQIDAKMIMDEFLKDKIQVNVFADLFLFTLFHFFINYSPKKYFQGKKIYIFRLFCLLPVIYALASYYIQTSYALGHNQSLPFAIFPFLTTKSPLVVGIFATISLWIKNREKIFMKIGATKEQFNVYLNSKRNSLSFSIVLSVIILLFAVLEVLFGFVLIVIYLVTYGDNTDQLFDFLKAFNFGQVIPCLLAIPFILLYSYTRDHKNTQIDLFVPIGGIGVIAFIYLEFFFNMITHLAGQ